MQPVQKHEQQLLHQIRYMNRGTPISAPVERAYLQAPRHKFVSRYRRLGEKEWREVHEGNLAEHLAAIYADGPLILWGDDDSDLISTISQPSLVLRMLDMLRLEPGHKVFELGAGSGWNAALLGQIVGTAGQVYSLEIIPEIAQRAAEAIQAQAIRNVSIVEGDGGEGYAPGAPFDRAIFTAGTHDLPRYFYRQMKDGGLLLVVVKSEGGGDCLFVLRKKESRFDSIESMQCGFVPMTGKYRVESLKPVRIEQAPEWPSLEARKLPPVPFWWGGKGKESFVWRTWGIRSFLGITEPLFQIFETEKMAGHPYEELYFGLWDKAGESVVLAKDDVLEPYGTPAAKDRLLEDLRDWVSLGMPTTASFQLQVFPSDCDLMPRKNQWIVKRSESQFVWSLT